MSDLKMNKITSDMSGLKMSVANIDHLCKVWLWLSFNVEIEDAGDILSLDLSPVLWWYSN